MIQPLPPGRRRPAIFSFPQILCRQAQAGLLVVSKQNSSLCPLLLCSPVTSPPFLSCLLLLSSDISRGFPSRSDAAQHNQPYVLHICPWLAVSFFVAPPITSHSLLGRLYCSFCIFSLPCMATAISPKAPVPFSSLSPRRYLSNPVSGCSHYARCNLFPPACLTRRCCL